jgi:hypothetical protein
LGGHLQIGPHYYPDRRTNGVQIIMRGPHGQRLAADPVYIRAHDQPRGSGFRWWHEELNVPPDLAWNPQQVVTGVMGLGDLPAGWSCPYTREQLGREIAKVEAAVRTAGDPASLEAVRAQNEKLRECHFQLGQNATYAGHLARIQVVSQLAAQKKGRVGAGVLDPGGRMRTPTISDYCRQNPAACRDVSISSEECAWYDLRCNLKENWWKVLLGGAAVVALYNAAAGVGQRIGGGK